MADDIDDTFFNATKLGGLVKRAGTPLQEVNTNFSNLFYADGSDALANDGLVIGFEHVPSSKTVHFKAFIQAFNETFNCDWAEEAVYGRADPIRMFKQTTRSMTLSFIVPAATTGEGYENLGKLQKLITFLYPSYTNADNALTISQSPLVRMKIMNLVTNNIATIPSPFTGTQPSTAGQDFDGFTAGANNNNTPGLLGAITNVSVVHNLDNPDMGVFHTAKGTIIPKGIEVTIDFKALHEQPLGWEDEDGTQYFSSMGFPYGTDLQGSLQDAGINSINALEKAQAIEARGYTEDILRQRQEEEDRRRQEVGLQAAKDLAKAELLKADGKTLNRKGIRMARRLEAGKVRNPDKAAAYAGALRTTFDGATAADVERVQKEYYEDARQAADERSEARWSWIK